MTSRWDEGEAHFEAALARNAGIGARPALVHTQHRYAEMLLARSRHDDRDKAMDLLVRAAEIGSRAGDEAFAREGGGPSVSRSDRRRAQVNELLVAKRFAGYSHVDEAREPRDG